MGEQSNNAPATETPYNLELDSVNKSGSPVDATEAGFYIAKNWFAKKQFSAYPRGQKAYKPVFLQDLDENLWKEFNSDVQHYMNYFLEYTLFYKVWTLVPPIYFLIMILPDLLWYYEIVNHGVGIVIGLILAVCFSLDTYLQRRLITKKIQPMYSLLIWSYKASFLKQGYIIRYVLEPTSWDGKCSYIVFRKASKDEMNMVDMEPQQIGYYMDEKFLGSTPFVKGMPMFHPPQFLHGVDSATWKSFAKAVNARKKTPLYHHKLYTIGVSCIVIPFVAALIYAVVVLSNVRHWIVLALFPIMAFIDMLVSFWRRHYVENVLCHEMRDLIHEYEGAFSKAGFGVSFELEYKFHYLFLNTYMLFWQQDVNAPSGDTPAEADLLV